VIIRQFQPAGDEADPADFLPTSLRDPETMLTELGEVLAAVKSPPLRSLLDAFLDDGEFCERFKAAPAGTRLHHAYRGGLLEHTLSMARCAVALASHYAVLDLDRLLTGVFLHDLGKVEELTAEPMLDYSDRGRLLGHIEIGARLLAERAARIEGFPAPLLDVLTHMVLSHHGRLEYGSPKLPMTPEGVALHHLDNLDAKLASVEALLEKGEGAAWSEYVRGFDRAFYLAGDGDDGGEN
jgi:3'-5' exoribonuclease